MRTPHAVSRLRAALARGDWVQAAGDDFGDAIPRHPLGAWRRRVGVRALHRLGRFQARLANQAHERMERLAAVPGLEVVGDSVPGSRGTTSWALRGTALRLQRFR